ncbi:MAG: hypothetical protein E6G73_03335, partial [Alphaproteobacteria bacterium]
MHGRHSGRATVAFVDATTSLEMRRT